MEQLVIDASVVLKWYLDGEEHGKKAMGLLSRYVSNELDIFAPSLLEYEVMNGLIIAQKRGRIEEEKVRIAIGGFMDLGIKLRNLSQNYHKVLHYCKAYNCSAYDASYMVIADEEGIAMVTSDGGLYNAVKNLKWIKWLGDFSA